MPYCKECGRELDSDAKFCTHCGTPVSAKAPPKDIKRAKARPEAPQTTKKQVIATMASIVIGIVIVAAVVAYIATEGGGGGGGAPKHAMLSVSAQNTNNVDLTIKHEGGDDIPWADLTVKVGDSSDDLTTINHGQSGSFSVGETVTIQDTGVSTTDGMITVYIIHVPSSQKIFVSSHIIVD